MILVGGLWWKRRGSSSLALLYDDVETIVLVLQLLADIKVLRESFLGQLRR
jgi:hypothetical protein